MFLVVEAEIVVAEVDAMMIVTVEVAEDAMMTETGERGEDATEVTREIVTDTAGQSLERGGEREAGATLVEEEEAAARTAPSLEAAVKRRNY